MNTGIFFNRVVHLVGSDYSKYLQWKRTKNQPKVYNVRLTAKFIQK